jgi:hypothetical protein
MRRGWESFTCLSAVHGCLKIDQNFNDRPVPFKWKLNSPSSAWFGYECMMSVHGLIQNDLTLAT